MSSSSLIDEAEFPTMIGFDMAIHPDLTAQVGQDHVIFRIKPYHARHSIGALAGLAGSGGGTIALVCCGKVGLIYIMPMLLILAVVGSVFAYRSYRRRRREALDLELGCFPEGLDLHWLRGGSTVERRRVPWKGIGTVTREGQRYP